jgi:hypothetical protein
MKNLKYISLLVLIFSINPSHSSVLEEEHSKEIQSLVHLSNIQNPTKIEEYDPRDINKDGKISFGERVHCFFDINKDGKINFEDLREAAFNVLDRNKDGKITIADASYLLEEIANVTYKISDILEKITIISNRIIDSPLITLLPEELSSPLTFLLLNTKDISGSLQDGVNIGTSYIPEIELSLKKVGKGFKQNKKNISKILEDNNENNFKMDVFEAAGLIGSLVDTASGKKNAIKIMKRVSEV